eukprot:jgi/Bigna1/39589/e_gw1.33.24.1
MGDDGNKTAKWRDTNMALFGSDLEKKIKAAAAMDEPAWKQAGQKVGLQIWRIEKFHVVEWPSQKKGQFHVGDSYIMLNTYKKKSRKNSGNEALAWDVHFWIGSQSTADEYGTAAYKTVELDHLLSDKAHQHRETEGRESKLFRSYFTGHNRLRYLSGGIETGFNHVEEKKVKPRLYRIKGLRGHISLKEVPMTKSSLNDGDVFILDKGDSIVQWNGCKSNTSEKRQGGEFIRDVKDSRGGKPMIAIIDQTAPGQESNEAEFWDMLGNKGKIQSARRGGNDADEHDFTPQLWRIREVGGGKITWQKMAEQKKIERARFASQDVFILDVGFHAFVWVGMKSSATEKASGMRYADHYLEKNGRPPTIPISRIREGSKRKNHDFEKYLNDDPIPTACACIIL